MPKPAINKHFLQGGTLQIRQRQQWHAWKPHNAAIWQRHPQHLVSCFHSISLHPQFQQPQQTVFRPWHTSICNHDMKQCHRTRLVHTPHNASQSAKPPRRRQGHLHDYTSQSVQPHHSRLHENKYSTTVQLPKRAFSHTHLGPHRDCASQSALSQHSRLYEHIPQMEPLLCDCSSTPTWGRRLIGTQNMDNICCAHY